MATRGIVAIATKEGWNGRYTHWDNYPQRMVGVLAELVARDGLEQVTKTLVSDNPSWSVIDPTTKPSVTGEPSHYEQHKCVTGYGYVHTDIDALENALFTQSDTDLAWCDWLYIMSDTGLEVRKIERDENGNDVTIHESLHTWESIAITAVAQ